MNQGTKIFSLIIIALSSQAIFAAEPVLDAGAVKRDNVPAPAPMPKPEATLPQAAEPSALSQDATPIEIKKITVTGATVFSTESLEALAVSYTHLDVYKRQQT